MIQLIGNAKANAAARLFHSAGFTGAVTITHPPNGNYNVTTQGLVAGQSYPCNSSTDGRWPVMRAFHLRSRTGSRRGQALVEFALVLPIFILLLVGIFDFGRAIYAYNTISNAAREAVRVGVVDQSCDAIGTEAAEPCWVLGITFAPTVAAPCGPAGTGVEIHFLNSDGSTPSGGDNCVEPDARSGRPDWMPGRGDRLLRVQRGHPDHRKPGGHPGPSSLDASGGRVPQRDTLTCGSSGAVTDRGTATRRKRQ